MTQVGSYPPRRARRAAGDAGRQVPAARPATAQRSRSAGSAQPAPHPAPDLERQGSHATLYGQGFSWVLVWTILGAVIPGVGLIAAGRRWLGAFVLFLVGLGGLAAVGFVVVGNPLERGVSLATNPKALAIAAVAVAAGGLLWAVVILMTSSQLRRSAVLSSGQRAFSGLVVLALIGGVALPAYKISQSVLITRGLITSKSIFGGDSTSTAGPNAAKADPWADKPRMNVLLIGSDAGADRTGIRPDTMILASIDTKTGNTVLFSLPRSLQKAKFAAGTRGAEVWPNGYDCGNECLLNAVWTWAESDPGYKKDKNPGLTATEDAVHGVTGLKVDTYVMLNLNGFKDFVDAIGKVTVDVHTRLPIGGNGDPTSSVYHVATGGWIEIGDNQKLDGFHALWFARSRWATDDYDRMARQRCMIGAVVKKADPATLALNFADIAKALKKNLQTGIATSQIDAWVELAQKVKGAEVTSLPFTTDVIDTVNPDFTEVHQLVQKALTASTAEPTTAAPTPSASATPTKKKKKKKVTLDPDKAQSLTAVC